MKIFVVLIIPFFCGESKGRSWIITPVVSYTFCSFDDHKTSPRPIPIPRRTYPIPLPKSLGIITAARKAHRLRDLRYGHISVFQIPCALIQPVFNEICVGREADVSVKKLAAFALPHCASRRNVAERYLLTVKFLNVAYHIFDYSKIVIAHLWQSGDLRVFVNKRPQQYRKRLSEMDDDNVFCLYGGEVGKYDYNRRHILRGRRF